MLVKLTRDARIAHKAGEIVEVSPVVFQNMVTLGVAEPVTEEKKKTTRAKKG